MSGHATPGRWNEPFGGKSAANTEPSKALWHRQGLVYRVERLIREIRGLLQAAEIVERRVLKAGAGIHAEAESIEQFATDDLPVAVANPAEWAARLRQAAGEVCGYVRSFDPHGGEMPSTPGMVWVFASWEETTIEGKPRQLTHVPKPEHALKCLRECEKTLSSIPAEFFDNPDLLALFRQSLVTGQARDDTTAEPPGGWSDAKSPSEWYRVFIESWKNTKRRVEKKEIRALRIHSKSWRFAVADLPAAERAKYKDASK